jgi:extracellular elastinolytic metalloproteinase
MLSRSLVAFALLLAASTDALHTPHDAYDVPQSRKTLNYRFDKPHARFVTLAKPPAVHNDFIATPLRDPFEVARELIDTLSPQSEEYSYRIRKDSYTDPTTRVTHVYAKQTYRGLDVDDGDVNINVLDGHVISYGNEVSLIFSF